MWDTLWSVFHAPVSGIISWLCAPLTHLHLTLICLLLTLCFSSCSSLPCSFPLLHPSARLWLPGGMLGQGLGVDLQPRGKTWNGLGWKGLIPFHLPLFHVAPTWP